MTDDVDWQTLSQLSDYLTLVEQSIMCGPLPVHGSVSPEACPSTLNHNTHTREACLDLGEVCTSNTETHI